MRRGVRLVALVLVLVIGGACSSDEDPALEDDGTTSSSAPDTSSTAGTDPGSSTTAGATGPSWNLELTGDAEVPGPGDADGSGTATVRLATERSEVCFTITVEGIGQATQAHIHRAPAGESGGVELNLVPPGADGKSEGCAAADAILLGEIEAAPEQFYVNVHNDEFPQGAVRGQLA